ncbi:MAG: MBL fold metallo-hydrolase [Thaumarchaeota archaeon]|nr:MBL fold metallo-hydrolase [Nitrososphaerota archaeon]MCL5318035.1 MBL fold metallo-hydrolase [Nitrososphaerota archaeon]
MIKYDSIEVFWLGHDCFRIEGSRVIYTDPYKLMKRKPADLILVTHPHADHLSPDDIRKLVTKDTVVVAPESCIENLQPLDLKDVRIVKQGDQLEVKDIEIRAVPMYNVNKFRSPGIPFHPKRFGVGYVFKMNGTTFYHTGDTDLIPEMEGLKVDVMFTPVSGTYVMTAQEASQATMKIKPKLAIPMHYGSIVGSRIDAEEFSRYAGCRVEILDKED